MDVRPSILVGIASHGTAQDHFLARVVSEYRKLEMPCRIVVLPNIDKHVEGAEVLVGVPTRDPYSLPFAHRRLFADNLDQYDLFIYAEDETLLTQRNIHAFLDLQQELGDTEILGFMRSETCADGTGYRVDGMSPMRATVDSMILSYRGHCQRTSAYDRVGEGDGNSTTWGSPGEQKIPMSRDFLHHTG
jgi:hypothetical protein